MWQGFVDWLYTDQANAQFLVGVLVLLVVFGIVLLTVAYLILLERRAAAWIQDRLGPNRVGWQGLLQPIADGLKLFLKEDYIPAQVDKPLFILAPMLVMIPALVGMAIIPWGGPIQVFGHAVQVQIASVPIGVLYILGVGGLGIYGVVVGGYASNSKYSFFGGLRSTAVMLSYEVPLGLTVLAMVLITGQLTLEGMVQYQIANGWNLLAQPLAALLLFTCIMAEGNRLPFDLAEAEQELVGGYHTEYSSMKFGLFFLAEYTHLIVGMALFVAIFLGGWQIPFIHLILGNFADPHPPGWVQLVQDLGRMDATDSPWWIALVRFGVYFFKVMLMIYVVMWIRWTIPRFRFDQLMRISWMGMIPLATVILVVNMLVLYADARQPPTALVRMNTWPVLLLLNVLLGVGCWWVMNVLGQPLSGRQMPVAPTPALAEE